MISGFSVDATVMTAVPDLLPDTIFKVESLMVAVATSSSSDDTESLLLSAFAGVTVIVAAAFLPVPLKEADFLLNVTDSMAASPSEGVSPPEEPPVYADGLCGALLPPKKSGNMVCSVKPSSVESLFNKYNAAAAPTIPAL